MSGARGRRFERFFERGSKLENMPRRRIFSLQSSIEIIFTREFNKEMCRINFTYRWMIVQIDIRLISKILSNEEETFIQLCPRSDLPRFKPCLDIFHPYSPIESSPSASLSFTCVYTPVEEREPP